MRNFLFFFIGIILFVSSCSSTNTEETNSNISIKSIKIKIYSPTIDSSLETLLAKSSITRSTIQGSGLSFDFGFTKGDTIGIFPENGYQIAFKLDVLAGQVLRETSILAEGWNTKQNILYSCYMPFIYDNRNYSHIPWNLEKIQIQRGNNNRDSMSNYALFASDTVLTKTNVFDTKLTYMGSMIAVVFSAPVTGSYKRVILSDSKKIFATRGYFDLFDINSPKEPYSNITSCPYLHQPFHGENYSDHVTLDLKDLSVNQGTQIWAWFIIPEAVAANSDLTLYIWDGNGNCYTATKSTTSNFRRNRITGLLFSNLTLTTTPYTNLNPWEEDKDTCSTCYPVAF